jgi:hypothetical protein
MSNLGDILTAAKNLVTAVNTVAQNYLNVQGASNLPDLTAATVLKTTAGRVCNVVVTVAGSAPGSVYDSNTTTGTSKKLFVIPNTTGVYVVNMPTRIGLLVVPGTGQTVTVSYS